MIPSEISTSTILYVVVKDGKFNVSALLKAKVDMTGARLLTTVKNAVGVHLARPISADERIGLSAQQEHPEIK